MAILDTIRLVVGIIGNIISFCLFFSPMTTFWKIIKWKDTKGFSGFPYVMTLLNCALWVLYGMPFVKPNSTLVITINGAGCIFEITYTAIFLIYCRNKSERLRMIALLVLVVAFFSALTALTLLLFHSYAKRATIVGTVCIVFNIVMYASPLSIMKKIIQEKSVKYLPFPLSLACTCNGLVWTAYGCMPFDRNLVIPNGLGSLLGIVQLMLYGIYYRSTNWDEDAADGEVEFTDRHGKV